MWQVIAVGALVLPLTITPVDGGGEVNQPQQQTTTIDSKIVAIAVDYHAALLLACSDLIHRKDVPEVEKCAKSYLDRIIHANKSQPHSSLSLPPPKSCFSWAR